MGDKHFTANDADGRRHETRVLLARVENLLARARARGQLTAPEAAELYDLLREVQSWCEKPTAPTDVDKT
ncbi:MAG: hypothetical protein KatS3mg023_0711 [Armatimonadota bacterium]|nr:MAG: hypothetical protein KatS3mg023_0711 [Armatimonadota bacterium]